MLELVAGGLLAMGAVWFVLLPVFRPTAQSRGPGASAALARHEREAEERDGEDPADDMSARAVALRALGEIEFDRATGKLSDADYEALKATYTTAALAALRAEQGVPGARPESSRPAVVRAPVTPRSCPTDGPRPELDAVFCSACGRRLDEAPGFCARCGTALELEARYCHTCGTRVAA